MQKIMMTMMALVLTIAAQAQQDEGLNDMMAAMIAAKVHQECIDTANLVAVYDYECRTQDAEGKPVIDRMKLCLLVGKHCTRSFPYRKFRMERQWASGQNADMRSRAGADGSLEFLEGYDFFSEEELPLLRSESYCMMPEVWTGYPNEEQVTVRDAIPPTIYETWETRKPIEWEINLSTLGEEMGVGSLHGLRWTVRYREDIPTTAGPWKLCGLPGLIVEAVSDDSIHHFKLAELQYATAPIYYETSAITVRTSEERLIKNRNRTFGNRLYQKNTHYYITDLRTVDTVYDSDGMLINGVYVNDKAHVYQPLEKK